MTFRPLFCILFVVTLVWSGFAYFQEREGMAILLLLMALASALNASSPYAKMRVSMSDMVRLFVASN